MSDNKYNLDNIKKVFFNESREILENMEKTLLEIEKDGENADLIADVFRAAHTIKGSAGMCGFNAISDFTHSVENLLDNIRKKTFSITPDIISLGLDCHDHILELVNYYESGNEGDPDPVLQNRSNELIQRLNSFLEILDLTKPGAIPGIINQDGIVVISVENECWHISLRFGKDVFKNGLDPQSFIAYLGKMGKIVNIKSFTESIPEYTDFDPESCYIGFEINFMGMTSKVEIEKVFEFFGSDVKINILPPGSHLEEYLRLIGSLPEKSMYIGEILIEIGSLTKKELELLLEMQSELLKNKSCKLIGELAVEEKLIQQPVIDAALEKQNSIKASGEQTRRSMRIETNKLDSLINLVGELVVSTSNIPQLIKTKSDNELLEIFSHLSRLVNNIRENSMNLRMVQIGDSFRKFERIVRDQSKQSGKKVKLVLKGEETELDKTIIEKITDPIMHIVRNAVDHGIDMSEERKKKGKPEEGIITLNAYNEAGNVVVEVIDDGNGLNKEKIISKAIEKRLISKDEAFSISDNEAYQLIFTPGFSTAEKITEVSGRGVGMDVVKKNIDNLRGSVVVQSREGHGSSFKILVPLTLAIIDGFLVKVGNQFYIMPLNMIVECDIINKSYLKENENGSFYNLRGELIPYLDMRDFLNEEGSRPEEEFIVIIEYFGKKAGFIVDEAYGEQQAVIKPLGKIFKRLKWISGASLLSGGGVGLVLDLAKLIQYVHAVEVKKVS